MVWSMPVEYPKNGGSGTRRTSYSTEPLLYFQAGAVNLNSEFRPANELLDERRRGPENNKQADPCALLSVIFLSSKLGGERSTTEDSTRNTRFNTKLRHD